MKSILDNRPTLRAEIEKVAEVAGYLWQNGWAERNGGNITVNVTEHIDDDIRRMPPIAPVVQIGMVLPQLKGKYFYCKGTGKRMRDLAKAPMQNGSIVRICDDCASYEIIADEPVVPTSELPTHLALQNLLLETGSTYKATLHTHPIELVAMSHIKRFLKGDEMTRVLWSMIPETLAFAPLGIGIVCRWPRPQWSRYVPTTWCCGRSMAPWPWAPTSWTPSTRPTCSARRPTYTCVPAIWVLNPTA